MERLINFVVAALFVIVSAALVLYIMFFAPLDTAQAAAPDWTVKTVSQTCRDDGSAVWRVRFQNHTNKQDFVSFMYGRTEGGGFGEVELTGHTGMILRFVIPANQEVTEFNTYHRHSDKLIHRFRHIDPCN